MPRRRAILDAAGLEVDYVEVAPFDPPTLAAAVRVGSTRLIDNIALEEDCEHSTPPRHPASAPGKLPITELAEAEGQPIVMVTAYDAPPRADWPTRRVST